MIQPSKSYGVVIASEVIFRGSKRDCMAMIKRLRKIGANVKLYFLGAKAA